MRNALLTGLLTELGSTERQVLASNKAVEEAPALTVSLAILLRLHAFLYPMLSRAAFAGQAEAIIAASTRGDVRSLVSDWTSIPENMGKRKLCPVYLKDKSWTGAVNILNIKAQLQQHSVALTLLHEQPGYVSNILKSASLAAFVAPQCINLTSNLHDIACARYDG